MPEVVFCSTSLGQVQKNNSAQKITICSFSAAVLACPHLRSPFPCRVLLPPATWVPAGTAATTTGTQHHQWDSAPPLGPGTVTSPSPGNRLCPELSAALTGTRTIPAPGIFARFHPILPCNEVSPHGWEAAKRTSCGPVQAAHCCHLLVLSHCALLSPAAPAAAATAAPAANQALPARPPPPRAAAPPASSKPQITFRNKAVPGATATTTTQQLSSEQALTLHS